MFYNFNLLDFLDENEFKEFQELSKSDEYRFFKLNFLHNCNIKNDGAVTYNSEDVKNFNDFEEISKVLEVQEKDSWLLRHCFNWVNTGSYYVLESTTDSNKRFYIDTNLEVALTGACWSCGVWLRLFLGQMALENYLHDLENKLLENGYDIKLVQDVPLYYPYLNERAFEEDEQVPDDVISRSIAKLKDKCTYKQREIKPIFEEVMNHEHEYSCYDYYNRQYDEHITWMRHLRNAISELYKSKDIIDDDEKKSEIKKIILEIHEIIHE